MKIIILTLTLIILSVPVFAEEDEDFVFGIMAASAFNEGLRNMQDKETEAEGPGRCAYCDEHTVRVDKRDMDTNPSAFNLLYVLQSAIGIEEPSEKRSDTGIR
ncbi:MAG: hypothetical protein OXK80_00225 [Bdellovibrionales bacterium]|nr:hypothetical protein [Bdellovibrionales bacterium]